MTDAAIRDGAAQLRRLLAEDGFVLAAGCFDALSARIAEEVGFRALHVTGFGVEAALLGAPDLGLVTQSELVGHVAHIADAVGRPIICDAETGFGGVHNIVRTVREMERIGVAAIHIEDQITPKRSPMLDGRVLLSLDDAAGRIAAACDARRSDDFMIIARTDGDAISFDETVTRSRAYLEAGADAVLPMMMGLEGGTFFSLPPQRQMEWYRQLAEAVAGPIMSVTVPDGHVPADMAAAGYSVVVLPALSIEAAANAMFEVLTEALGNGTGERYLARHSTRVRAGRSMLELLHLDRYVAREDFYGPRGAWRGARDDNKERQDG